MLLTLFFVIALGCRHEPAPPNEEMNTREAVSLTLLVLDDPELAAAVRRQWSERGEGELVVLDGISTELLANPKKPALGADTIIFPAGLMGQFIESNLIAPLPAKTLRDPNLAWSDIFDLVRLREVTWDRKVYALPLGSPQFALFYRADLWSRFQLPQPNTWDQFHAAIFKLRDAATQDSALNVKVLSAEPLAPGWAGQALLARASAYARHRNFLSALFELETMKPLIDGPPFVRALAELTGAVGTTDALQWGPHDTLQQLISGNAAAAIGWPAARKHESDAGAAGNAEKFEIAIAEMPGSEQSYDRTRGVWDPRASDEIHVTFLTGAGRLAAVSSRASNQQAAANLLIWIAGKEWSAQLAPASRHVTLYRFAHMNEPQRWVDAGHLDPALAANYAQVVSQTLTRSESVLSIRIPGRDEYMTALDDAVARVVRGEASAAESLKQAADTWNTITDRLGRESQNEAYRHSLGL